MERLVVAEKMTIEKLGGVYANHLKIGQNAFEFLFDFGQLYLEDDDAQFHTRIITTPVYAKAFLKVLADCLERYERDFGTIPEGLISSRPADKWWMT